MWRLVVLCLIALLAGFGCWDLKEIEDLGFVTGIGVDTAPHGNIKLLAQLLNSRVVGGTPRGGITPGASTSAK